VAPVGQPGAALYGALPLEGQGLHMMCVGQESCDNRSDKRGMQERLHGTGALRIDLVQAVYRLVQADAQFHLPAHPIEGGDLPWPKPRG